MVPYHLRDDDLEHTNRLSNLAEYLKHIAQNQLIFIEKYLKQIDWLIMKCYFKIIEVGNSFFRYIESSKI